MIPKKPAPDLIRGGNRFSDKIMRHYRSSTLSQVFSVAADSCTALHPWGLVTRLAALHHFFCESGCGRLCVSGVQHVDVACVCMSAPVTGSVGEFGSLCACVDGAGW